LKGKLAKHQRNALTQQLGDFNNTGDNRVTEMTLTTILTKMLREEKRTSLAKRKTTKIKKI
jgi:hypothetical protein